MPELPEVETFRRYLVCTSLGKRIIKVDLKDLKVIRHGSEQALRNDLIGESFTEACRIGKHVFLHLSGGRWLDLHFGMTGSPEHFLTMDDEPRYDRFLITFEGDDHLAFDDPRKLGRIGISKSIEEYVEKKHLGPDALYIGLDEFASMTSSSSRAIKTVLMDQTKVAGVGNLYADEILFRSRIDPRARSNTLSDEQVRHLYDNMRCVLQISVDLSADLERFPSTFFLRHRHKGGSCPGCQGSLSIIQVGGRTTYFCPQCQKDHGAGVKER